MLLHCLCFKNTNHTPYTAHIVTGKAREHDDLDDSHCRPRAQVALKVLDEVQHVTVLNELADLEESEQFGELEESKSFEHLQTLDL